MHAACLVAPLPGSGKRSGIVPSPAATVYQPRRSTCLLPLPPSGPQDADSSGLEDSSDSDSSSSDSSSSAYDSSEESGGCPRRNPPPPPPCSAATAWRVAGPGSLHVPQAEQPAGILLTTSPMSPFCTTKTYCSVCRQPRVFPRSLHNLALSRPASPGPCPPPQTMPPTT